MSGYGRKHEHVEPRDIAGSDLPDWLRHQSPTARALNATEKVLIFSSGMAACALWLNWDTVVNTTLGLLA